MTILSYRGSGSPGGVSGAIARVFDTYTSADERWWHLSENRLIFRQSRALRPFCVIPEPIVSGHYRYCHDFLWPVLHDMPEYASFLPQDWQLYQQFNLAFAINVLHEERLHTPTAPFVQDYQLALAPAIMSRNGGRRASIFWHVPWPRSIEPAHVPMLAEIATALLASGTVGFHIGEYVENFLGFVQSYLGADYFVDEKARTVRTRRDADARPTSVIAQPLGLDVAYWTEGLELSERRHDIMDQIGVGEYVLSVDRVDYTKGVAERLHAIDEFFARYPAWRHKISFVQICQRTRPGLDAFDSYWARCSGLVAEVNARWSTESWKPIIWIPSPVAPAVLAKLYGRARAMLVSPLRDGLNLTAKEFVACAGENAGALLLSDGAGVWHEFADQSVRIVPGNAKEMATSIHTALALPLEERRRRCAELAKRLHTNNLAEWWHRFAGAPALAHYYTSYSRRVGGGRELNVV